MSKKGGGETRGRKQLGKERDIVRMDMRGVRELKEENKWEKCSCSRNVKQRMCMVGKGTINNNMDAKRVGWG